MQKFIKQNKLLSLIIGVGIIVVLYLYLTPDSSTVSHPAAIVADDTSDSTATTDVEDDTNVHFPRYVGSNRDPFIPKIAADNPNPNGPGGLVNGKTWQLTGINSINGQTTALLENSQTQQSVFLKVGDGWNGLTVISISDDAVNFVNSLGQVSQLGFAQPDSPSNTAENQVPGSNGPSVNQINPLPPLTPNFGTQSFRSFRQNGGQLSN